MIKILAILLLSVSLQIFGQSLIVTPFGLRDSNDTGKTFVVLKVDSMSAKQLYNNAIKYINKTYKDPKEVLKGNIESEYISYKTHVSEFLVVNNSWAKIPIEADYTVELNFKDGKTKYEVINLEMYSTNDGQKAYSVLFSGGAFDGYPIYNKEGELKRQDTKNDIETYFKTEIKSLQESLRGTNSQKENW